MPFTRANGIRLYYEIQGQGPRLFFINGSGNDLRNRPNVFDSVLARHFEILSYDQRGLGQSDKPETAYRMADYADDAAALLGAVGWPAVSVMGVSFGGMVAPEFALRHGPRVSQLVLACTSSGGAGGASFPLHELESLPEAERAATQLELADVRRDAAWRAANPERWAQFMAMAMQSRRPDRDPAGAARQLAARIGHDTWDRLVQLRMPVLLVGGEFDGIAPPANMRALQQQITGAQLRFFAGGHQFLVQDKAAYPYVIQWLTERLGDSEKN